MVLGIPAVDRVVVLLVQQQPLLLRGLALARTAVAPVPTALPSVSIPAPDPAAYDGLLADPIIEGASP